MRSPASRCRPVRWRWPKPNATCRSWSREVEALLDKHGLRDAPILLRISGCPNGCSRPYLGEIALVGKAPGRYNLMLGADARGQRLNRLHRENIDEAEILATLDGLFARYAGGARRRVRASAISWCAPASSPARDAARPSPWRLSREPARSDRAAEDERARIEINQLARASHRAEQRLAWALETLPGEHVLSSSFGAQSAAMLHLVTRRRPDMPVVLIDTGYLFPETYRFADELVERFALNLKVYPARDRHRLDGSAPRPALGGGHRRPRALQPPAQGRTDAPRIARAWRAHLDRRLAPRAVDARAPNRACSNYAKAAGNSIRSSTGPIATCGATWSSIVCRITRCGRQGYVSIGDVHTTHPLERGMREEDTRFFGLKRECGLHYDLSRCAGTSL